MAADGLNARAVKPAATQPRSHWSEGKAEYEDVTVHRRVTAKGRCGVPATVVVITQRGQVWVSVSPPFTWEAILHPGEVDALIRALELARDDAAKMAPALRRRFTTHSDSSRVDP